MKYIQYADIESPGKLDSCLNLVKRNSLGKYHVNSVAFSANKITPSSIFSFGLIIFGKDVNVSSLRSPTAN